jgi:nucleotide-binding universal stress UspA family protein
VVVGAQGDGSDAAALEFAAAEAEGLGRQLVVVHTWQALAFAARAATKDFHRDATEAAGKTRLDEVVERLRRAHARLDIAPMLGHESPMHLLVDEGRTSSLVVVGTHRMSEADRSPAPSVSRQVLERPTCPVAVVPTVSGGAEHSA